jgi:hypothetical protein
LAQAEEFLRSGEERIAAQRQLIEEMEKAGRDTELAVTVLSLLEHSHEIHIADKERLMRELANFPARHPADSEGDDDRS